MNRAFVPVLNESLQTIPAYKYPGSEKGPDPLDDPDHFA